MSACFSPVAVELSGLPAQLGHIFYFIVLPVMVLAGIGWLLQRRLGLDMPTLARLNFHFIIPGMIYFSVVTRTASAADVVGVMAFSAAVMIVQMAVTWAAAVARRVPGDQRNALVMTTVFNNSGNYGIPLQRLAFESAGLAGPAKTLQIFYMLMQNIGNFTLGVVLAASGHRRVKLKELLLHIAKFPPLYALAAAFLTVWIRSALSADQAARASEALRPFIEVLKYVEGAFIAVALCTLGAQLATVQREGPRYPVTLSIVLRLLLGPAIGLAVIYASRLVCPWVGLEGITGFYAQLLLIATSTPTAVNTMLLCLEFDNHPDFAARAVFYSTLLSPVTVTLVIFLAQSGLLPGFAMDGAADITGSPERRVAACSHADTDERTTMTRRTSVSIEGREFRINGRPTYEGRRWRGHTIEGLLMNSRMVQGIFDDRNAETRPLWAYPDGPWDTERNTREFLAAMPEWRRHGLLAFTINLQGGNPRGYGRDQPWHNSAFEADGSLRADYLARLEKILDRADEVGMAVILGYFYFGQDERLRDEAAVVRAADAATDWLLGKGYTNVLVEIANEVDVPRYEHDILEPPRCHELIRLVQDRSKGRAPTPAGRLLVGTSMGGGSIPPDNVITASDFLLLHGNGVKEPDRIREMVRQARASKAYRDQPLVFNEDDHFDFEKPDNNMIAAVSEHASWGYFDYRMKGEGFDDGYQSVPVNWGISSPRKQGFFKLLAEVTGAK